MISVETHYSRVLIQQSVVAYIPTCPLIAGVENWYHGAPDIVFFLLVITTCWLSVYQQNVITPWVVAINMELISTDKTTKWWRHTGRISFSEGVIQWSNITSTHINISSEIHLYFDMVNGLYLYRFLYIYIALYKVFVDPSKALYTLRFIHPFIQRSATCSSFTHIHTHCHQEQLRVKLLAQEYIDMSTTWAAIEPTTFWFSHSRPTCDKRFKLTENIPIVLNDAHCKLLWHPYSVLVTKCIW